MPALLVLAGCGSSDPSRFDLSGTVTYDGEPVPVGYMVFASDSAAGNAGPGAQADIRDGKFSTGPERGTVGGPHVVTIFGFDGKPYQIDDGTEGPPMVNPMGKPLFETVTMKVEVPKETAVHDFAIPKQ